MSSLAPMTCPNCHFAIRAAPSTCPKCGFSLQGGVVLRDLPDQTHGIDAVARKFGARNCFGLAALMVFAAFVYYDDIGDAEHLGKSFMADPVTELLYRLAGKWAAVSLWLTLAIVFVLVALRARKLAAPR